jgi:polyhydroxybutyrate depolymerase
VAYPDAVTGDWAEGCNCSAADLAGVNDTGFVRLLIQQVDDEYGVDRSRVYAAGYSAGGLFTHRLACEMGDEFAAIASVVAPMSLPLSLTCIPALPVSVLGIQGTEDEVFPFDGNGEVLGASETIKAWADRNNCPDTAEISHPPDLVDDGTTVAVERYRPCDSSTESTLIGVTGGVHAWTLSAEFETALIITAFFLEHGR